MAAPKHHVAFTVTAGDEAGTSSPAAAPASAAAAASVTSSAEGSGEVWRTLKPKAVLGAEDFDAYSVRFSPDGRFVAVGTGDGSVRVFAAATGDETFRLRPTDPGALPVTSLRWRPASATHAGAGQNVLLAVGSDGSIRHWHVTSSKCLNFTTEKGNQIFACDYRPDAEKFVTAGKDGKLRLYDDMTRACELVLEGGTADVCAGHTSRVFSVKFNAEDPRVLVSGGWDNTIQVWDVRVGRSVRSIFGPHICGDAVDLQQGTLITGSWRPKDALQLWDFASGRQILTADVKSKTGEPCLLYAAQSSPKGGFLAVGGTGSNEARVLRTSGQFLAMLVGFPKGVFALDFSPDDSSLVAVGPQAGQIVDLRNLH